MTEKEVILYLKENKKNGVAFDFMPSEVRDWCKSHRDETIFHVFSDTWRTLRSTILCEPHGIYCLTKDYEPKSEFKHYWQEFLVGGDCRLFYKGVAVGWFYHG